MDVFPWVEEVEKNGGQIRIAGNFTNIGVPLNFQNVAWNNGWMGVSGPIGAHLAT